MIVVDIVLGNALKLVYTLSALQLVVYSLLFNFLNLSILIV